MVSIGFFLLQQNIYVLTFVYSASRGNQPLVRRLLSFLLFLLIFFFFFFFSSSFLLFLLLFFFFSTISGEDFSTSQLKKYTIRSPRNSFPNEFVSSFRVDPFRIASRIFIIPVRVDPYSIESIISKIPVQEWVPRRLRKNTPFDDSISALSRLAAPRLRSREMDNDTQVIPNDLLTPATIIYINDHSLSPERVEW